MDLEALRRDTASRRRFLRLAGVGLAGSSATLLAACGGGGAGTDGGGAVATTTTQLEPEGTAGSGDVTILNSALDLENRAVAAYTAGVPRLRGAAAVAARRILEQEREHVDALATAIRQLGGMPNRPKAAYDFPRWSSQHAFLAFATDLANTAIAAYVDALPRLVSPDLRGTTAAIATNEAQHASVLLGERGLPQVPSAFVTGKL
jgi:rubrerythrin